MKNETNETIETKVITDIEVLPPVKASKKAAKPAAKKAKKAVKKAAPAKATKAAKKAAKPAVEPAREGSKKAQVIALLSRPKGAPITEIMEKMGWQRHTVRGFMAGALKNHGVLSFLTAKGERAYRIGK